LYNLTAKDLVANFHSKKLKNYTPEEKVRILKKHLVENVPGSDLCDQHGLHPTVFYRWQKQLFESGNPGIRGRTKLRHRYCRNFFPRIRIFMVYIDFLTLEKCIIRACFLSQFPAICRW
jgi:hypothetical protein